MSQQSPRSSSSSLLLSAVVLLLLSSTTSMIQAFGTRGVISSSHLRLTPLFGVDVTRHHLLKSKTQDQGNSRTTRVAASTTLLYLSSSSSTTTTKLLSSTFKKIFVAGGSRGVGRYVIDQLLSQLDGVEEVVALVRTTEAMEKLLEHPATAAAASTSSSVPRLTVIQGDAMDYKTVENAMDGCDAAITTLGGGTGETSQDQRIDYQGNNNVIEAAGILGVTRVILVTSIGCGSSKAAAPPNVFEVLKDVLAAKERAENVLIKYYTNMNWTIVRPGGLKTEAATGRAILTEDSTAIGSIHREDLAQLILQALVSPKTERKILSAVDPTLTSSINLDGREVEAFVLA